MDCFLLQDWLTLQGAATTPGIVIVQPEPARLDLYPYQDVVGWLEVKSSLNAPGFAYQTSPTHDEALYQSMAPAFLPSGLSVTTLLKASAAVPLARWVRWMVAGPAGLAWNITFRVFIAANRVGKRGSRAQPSSTSATCGCGPADEAPPPVDQKPGPDQQGGPGDTGPRYNVGGAIGEVWHGRSGGQVQGGGFVKVTNQGQGNGH